MSVTPAIYNFSDPAVQVNPYPIYEWLRRETPVRQGKHPVHIGHYR